MRRLPRIAWMVALAVAVSACDDVDTDDPVPEPPDTPDVQQEEEPPEDTVTFSFSLEDGAIQADSVIEIPVGSGIQWAGADTDAVWVVAFPDSVPFQPSRMVFHGGDAPEHAVTGRVEAAVESEYKFAIFYPLGEGRYEVLDPKLVVIEEPR